MPNKGHLLLQAQKLVAMNHPGRHDRESVINYIYNTSPLLKGHDDFIYRKEDLVSLRPGRECAWLDVCVEKILRAFKGCKILRVRGPNQIQLRNVSKHLIIPL
jgi:hypothetical protein